jgi:aspartate oxidase
MASNSLLECAVFAKACANHINTQTFEQDYPSKHTGYFPVSDHKQNSIQIVDASSVSLKGIYRLSF